MLYDIIEEYKNKHTFEPVPMYSGEHVFLGRKSPVLTSAKPKALTNRSSITNLEINPHMRDAQQLPPSRTIFWPHPLVRYRLLMCPNMGEPRLDLSLNSIKYFRLIE